MLTFEGPKKLRCDNCGDELELLPDRKRRKGGITLTDRMGPKTVVWRFCDEMCFARWLDSPARREIWPSM